VSELGRGRRREPRPHLSRDQSSPLLLIAKKPDDYDPTAGPARGGGAELL